MSSDLLFGLFGLLAGLWFGAGTGPAMLVWMRNPESSLGWRLMACAMTIIEGPLRLAAVRH